MATTTTVKGITTCKGPHIAGGELYCIEFGVNVSGTYAAAGKPNFDVLAALEAARKQAITAVQVVNAVVFQDGNDGTNRYTPTTITLSGTGNKVVTFKLEGTDSTHTNGTGTGEIADATALNHNFSFHVIVAITGAL